jgi:hypothetical protein
MLALEKFKPNLGDGLVKGLIRATSYRSELEQKGETAMIAVTRRLLAASLCAALAAIVIASWGSARAEEPAALDRQAAQRVIESQIQAFLREDGAEAFSYAAPIIREKFGTPENFMRMVKTGYRPVYDPQSYEFGESRLQGGEILQEVILVAPDGRAKLAVYKLERMSDGTWKINAVYLKDLPEQIT